MAERTRALNTGREADPLTVSCDQPRSASPDLRDRAGLPGGRCEALARRTRAGGKAGRRLLFIVNDTTFFASHRLPIAVAAREAGFEVALAALDTGRVDEIRAQGIAYHPLAVDRTGVNPLRDVRLFWQLSRLIRTVRPTLLHTVTIKPVIYGGIAARLYRVPSLVSAVSGLGLVFIDEGRRPCWSAGWCGRCTAWPSSTTTAARSSRTPTTASTWSTPVWCQASAPC